MKKMKKRFKNEKGFTLVELLAVIVILGIIAAIAIPSIGAIIDNSKKDAHIANAEMLISASRLAVAANDTALWAGDNTITMQELVNHGYLESTIEDPDGTEAGYTTAEVKIEQDENSFTYKVSLANSKRTISEVEPQGLDRSIFESAD